MTDFWVALAQRIEYAAFVPTPHPEIERSDLRRSFMLFTNDMDRSRGQSFAQVQPELYEHIAATGFRWTAETLHAHHHEACASTAPV